MCACVCVYVGVTAISIMLDYYDNGSNGKDKGKGYDRGGNKGDNNHHDNKKVCGWVGRGYECACAYVRACWCACVWWGVGVYV